MPTSSAPFPSRHWIDRWIPWVFVLGMAIVVVVNGALIFFAVYSWTGVAVERPYERGLAYNRVLEAAAREEALGWRVDAALHATGTEIAVELRDAASRPLRDAQVAASLVRPLDGAAPIPVTLRYLGEGRYAGAIEALRRGQWEVRIAATRGADSVHVSRRLIVP